MAGSIPTIPGSILRQLSSQVSQSTLSRASLEAAARQMGVGLGEFMNALHAAQGEIGSQLSAGPTRQAAASLARQVYGAAHALEGASEIAALETAAGQTAATVAGSVATGGRVLGFFGRIGSFIGLSGAAATAAGVVATVATLGVIVAGGAQLAGSMSGDDPVQYGSAVNEPRGEPPAAPTNTAAPEEKYAVWLLENVSDGTIYVSQESSLKGTLTCQFGGGGLCANAGGADRPLQYRKLSQDYSTYAGAHTDFCSAIEGDPQNVDIAFASRATLYGGLYWIDEVQRC